MKIANLNNLYYLPVGRLKLYLNDSFDCYMYAACRMQPLKHVKHVLCYKVSFRNINLYLLENLTSVLFNLNLKDQETNI